MRMQRWATKLSAYDYDIKYRSSGEHSNADAMSRLPRSTADDCTEDLADAFQLEQLEALPVTAETVRQHTANDPSLQRIYQFIQHGPPNKTLDVQLQPFGRVLNELSLNRGCIMRGHRVVVPASLQAQILCELHEGHMGIVKMKEIARNYIWWPGLDQDIETLARSCASCHLTRNSPPSQRHPWQFPSAPWQRIHMDFAGPVDNLYFLLVIDAYSKWLEVIPMRTITASATIEALRNMFARFGIPSTVVSDNGPQFTSSQFTEFMARNGIRYITTAPHHPASNGQAERYVQTFKQAYGAGQGTLSQKITNFLLQYRNSPNGTTRLSPAQLMFGRPLRTRLDLINPLDASRRLKGDITPHVHPKRVFSPGKEVWYRNFARDGGKWAAGTVSSPIGNTMYEVKPQSHPECTVRRHVDQILRRDTLPTPVTSTPRVSQPEDSASVVTEPRETTRAEVQETPRAAADALAGGPTVELDLATPITSEPTARRSSRANKGIPPERLDL